MQAILTHTDLLTSLPNRKALEAELERAASQSSRTPLATVFSSTSTAFRAVNREYGHQGGDVILRQAAGILKKLARGRDLVARLGGDKFALAAQSNDAARCAAICGACSQSARRRASSATEIARCE